MYEWIKEDTPDVFFTRACHHNGRLLKSSQEETTEAVAKLFQSTSAPAVAEKHGISVSTLHDWKNRCLATNGKSALLMTVIDDKQDQAFLKYLFSKDRSSLPEEKEALARQVENLQDEVYRLRMERDTLAVYGEILKKEMEPVLQH